MGQICGFRWTRKIKKAFSFKGLCPLTPHRGIYSLVPGWGLRPRTLVIGSGSALAIVSNACQGTALT